MPDNSTKDQVNLRLKMANGDFEEKKEINDFDDILDYIGGWGPFQYLLTLGFFPFNVFMGYVMLSPILTTFAPPHWCHVPALLNISTEHRRELAIPRDPEALGGFSQCEQYLMNWNQKAEEWMNPKVSKEEWPVGKCQHGWEYDIENYHRSVVSDMDWVCEKSWIPALSQSLFFLGAVPGTMFGGWAADNYGRLPTIIISNIIGLVSGVATPFVTEHYGFLVLRFIQGLSYLTLFSVPYMLAMEYVEVSKRTLVGNLGLATCLTVSGVLQPVFIRYLVDWRVFNWIIFSQIGLVIFTPFLMPESVRWLMSRGESEKAMKIVKKIAEMNKKEVPGDVYRAVVDICEKQKVTNSLKPPVGYLDLFRTSRMRRVTFISIILWMFISLLFDASVRNISNLDFSIYISFGISAALELPADLLSIVGLDKLGRRWSASLSLVACGLSILPCAWLHDYVVLQSVFAMSGRFFATYAMNTGFQFTTEVMPTEIRGQGTALVNMMSMLAQMASPYIIYSSVISEKAPFMLLGLIGLVASIPGLYLPETAGVTLPDTIRDMENFGRNDRFFWIPLWGADRRLKSSSYGPEKRTLETWENQGVSSV